MSAGVPPAVLARPAWILRRHRHAPAPRYRSIPVGALWTPAVVPPWCSTSTPRWCCSHPCSSAWLDGPVSTRSARGRAPLLSPAWASSVLPISNLTTLIAVDEFGPSAGDVLADLALPSLAASIVGWLVFRRRFPTHLASPCSRRARSSGIDLWRCGRGRIAAGLPARSRSGDTALDGRRAADVVLIAAHCGGSHGGELPIRRAGLAGHCRRPSLWSYPATACRTRSRPTVRSLCSGPSSARPSPPTW